MRPQHDTHRVPTVALAPLIQAWIEEHNATHAAAKYAKYGASADFSGGLNVLGGMLAERAAKTAESWVRQLYGIMKGEYETVGFNLADEIVCYGLGDPWLWHGVLAEWYWPAQPELAAA